MAMLEPGLEAVHLGFLGFGPLAVDVEALAADPRFGGRVHLLPTVAPLEVVRWVSSVDVAAMAIQATNRSYELSTPNKMFEAFAAGRAGRRERLPGDPDDRAETRTGRSASCSTRTSAASIGAAIRRILDLPPDEYAAMAELARRAAVERWNWETESAGWSSSTRARGRPGEPSERAADIVRQRATLVLPSSGAFDSRAWRIASSLAARGHDVTVLARAEPDCRTG